MICICLFTKILELVTFLYDWQVFVLQIDFVCMHVLANAHSGTLLSHNASFNTV